MKKETAGKIKAAAAGIAMLAGVICYNMEWKSHAQATEIDCTATGEMHEAEETEVTGEIFFDSPDRTEQETAAAEATENIKIFIHVCGEVNAPGVYELDEGSRIYQAVDMAGGFTDNAVRDFLNMAGVLEDGMKIQIPNREEAGEWSSREALDSWGVSGGRAGVDRTGTGRASDSGGNTPSKVNLNTATKEQLMTLKGIGEARAEAIIAYRQENGPFAGIEDIMEVSGIKEAAFQKIKEDITV